MVGFLKQTIENRFVIKDISDGYYFFPVELGGLEVHAHSSAYCRYTTPFLIAPVPCLMSLRKQRRKSAEIQFERGETHELHDQLDDPKFKPHKSHTLMPFLEYIKYREELNYGFPQLL